MSPAALAPAHGYVHRVASNGEKMTSESFDTPDPLRRPTSHARTALKSHASPQKTLDRKPYM